MLNPIRLNWFVVQNIRIGTCLRRQYWQTSPLIARGRSTVGPRGRAQAPYLWELIWCIPVLTNTNDRGLAQRRIQDFWRGCTMQTLLLPYSFFPLSFPDPLFYSSSPPQSIPAFRGFSSFPTLTLIQLGGLGERCTLLQWGRAEPGRQNTSWCIMGLSWKYLHMNIH